VSLLVLIQFPSHTSHTIFSLPSPPALFEEIARIDSFLFSCNLVHYRDSIKNKYYALSAASALFKWLETRGRTFQARSLKIRYLPLEGTMLIDSETAKNLELVENVSMNPCF